MSIHIDMEVKCMRMEMDGKREDKSSLGTCVQGFFLHAVTVGPILGNSWRDGQFVQGAEDQCKCAMEMWEGCT